ncbi:MAG: PilZ domain-containing protein [Acidobacteria bacterium]|nr:PilZ domain-containing protein [Acidobacteriota bacterium]
MLLRIPGGERGGSGLTQNLSSRGAMLWTDVPLSEGEQVEMTLVMPSEITLAEDMSVCCRVRVVRRGEAEGGRDAVAVRIEHYDYLYREIPVLEEPARRAIRLVRP